MTSSPWKSNEIFCFQNLFKENWKKITTLRIFSRFLIFFRRTYILILVVEVWSIKKIDWIFSSMRTKITKNWNFGILFRFCTKNPYFFTILIQFESTLNWLSIIAKIMIIAWLTAEHLRFVKKISFKMPENSSS